MKNLSFVICFAIWILSVTIVKAQINRTDLEGVWQSNNQDSLYYKSDTIHLHLDINHFIHSNTETSFIILWNIKKGRFDYSYILTSEPNSEFGYKGKEKLLIQKTDFGQVITLKWKNRLFDKFKVIDLLESRIEEYPYDIKQLIVLRFDDIIENKLFNYVDSLVYDVLRFEPTKIDSADYKSILGNAAATTATIRIGNEQNKNPKPILVINGHPMVNFEILKEFLFVESIKITCLTREQSASLYGARAINGAIVIQVPNRKFKNVWKKYGG